MEASERKQWPNMTDGGCIAARGEECSMAGDKSDLEPKADVVQFLAKQPERIGTMANQALRKMSTPY